MNTIIDNQIEPRLQLALKTETEMFQVDLKFALKWQHWPPKSLKIKHNQNKNYRRFTVMAAQLTLDRLNNQQAGLIISWLFEYQLR